MKDNKKWSIAETYNGVKYRSKLEAAHARFFDRYGIAHVYEVEGFKLPTINYLPDFLLPEINTFLEVKGVMEEPDYTKLRELTVVAAQNAKTVILSMYPAGDNFQLCRPTPQNYYDNPYTNPPSGKGTSIWATPGEPFKLDDVWLQRCAFCNKVFFCDPLLGWTCQHCGKSDGNNHLLPIDEYVDVWTPRPCDMEDGRWLVE